MRARSALKLSLTLSRSSGCVQQAAPQEASPPKYQRDVRASAMVRAAATWPDPGEHHNSGSSRSTPGSKCYRAPAPGAANAPARPQGRGLWTPPTTGLRLWETPPLALKWPQRGAEMEDPLEPTVKPRELAHGHPHRLWLWTQFRRRSAILNSSGGYFPTSTL